MSSTTSMVPTNFDDSLAKPEMQETPPTKKRKVDSLLIDAPANTEEKLEKMVIQNTDWTKITWSADQLAAIAAVRAGRNLFITGAGGVGKSTLLPHLIYILQEEMNLIVRATATTGIAALNIGGTTLHSFLGAGLAKESKEVLLRKLQAKPEVKARLTQVDALLIDEVSMLAPDFFEKVNYLISAIRGRPNEPFGGMRVILFGDFFQLPPVVPKDEVHATTPNVKFCFELPIWWKLNLVCIELTKVFRQSDATFIEMLQRIRRGETTQEDFAKLKERLNAHVPSGLLDIVPTQMYSRTRTTEQKNQQALAKLPGESVFYEHKMGWTILPGLEKSAADVVKLNHISKLIHEHPPADKTLELKVGAQVVLLVNLNQAGGLVNGSRGVVTGFEGVDGKHPIVKFASSPQAIAIAPYNWKRGPDDGFQVYFKQVPLKLAFALTIHKCQGMSLDRAEIGLDEVFEDGQGYVALSRCRSLEGLVLRSFDETVLHANSDVIEFYKSGFAKPKYVDISPVSLQQTLAMAQKAKNGCHPRFPLCILPNCANK